MLNERKVVWNEGTFIAPQHFQQTERYYDSMIRNYHILNQGFSWGICELNLNVSSLKLGMVSLENISGFFADGSFFNETIHSSPHLTIKLIPNLESEYIYLVWSTDSLFKRNYGFLDDADVKDLKYIIKNVALDDHTNPTLPKRELLLANPNLRLARITDINENENKLPIAKIAYTTATGEIILDDTYIPSVLNLKSNSILSNYVFEIMGLLKQRAVALSAVLNNPTLKGTGEMRDFLMLQTINRYFAYIHHVSNSLEVVHPYIFYENLLKLLGDLSTFNVEKLNFDFPIYDHNNLNFCYKSIFLALKEVLSIVLQQRAINIPLEQRDDATRVAITPDASLLNTCTFVLAISASLSSEMLRQRIPMTIKIGSIEKIQDLIAYHLPGIHVQALSTAPRELPYHSGSCYFEIDKNSELWMDLHQSSGMAIHLAGEFPDLEIECWAIRSY